MRKRSLSKMFSILFAFCGALAVVSSAQTLTTLVNFNGPNGAEPRYGSLVQGTDGNFYGTTRGGGAHSRGTVFEMTPSGTLTTLYNFCLLPGCTDGGTPFAGLMQGSDGIFYGTTSGGGAHLSGTVFKITSNGSLTTLYSFAGSDGSAPYGKLVQASDGNLYGTTSMGGNSQSCTFGCGTTFKISRSGAFTSLHSFSLTDGGYVIAGLIQASDGNFYGAAGTGGNSRNCGNGCGTIFKMTPSGTLTTLQNFAGFSTDGSLPVAGLLQASNGAFYGTTESGGSTGDGAVFSLTGPPVSTTTVVTGTPNPSEVGQAVTLTATVSPSGPTGTVDFTSNGTGISGCSAVPLNLEMAVCMTSTLPVGTDAIVATYSGDTNYSGSSGTFSQLVNPLPVAMQFVPVPPCRVVDTRNSNGPFGGPPIPGGTFRSFAIPSGACDIPSAATAYSLNVTVVPSGSLGYLTIWPEGEGQPVVSTMNSLDGRIKANAAIVPAGTNGAVSVYVTSTTNVVLDIDGYFTAPGADTLQFYALTPCRVADTRHSNGLLGSPYLQGGHERDFPILEATSCNIPSRAQAYSLNFTAIPRNGGGLGYLTVWPQGQSKPLASTLNDLTGTIVANAALVPAGTGGGIAVYPSNDTDLVIDVNGYFAPAGADGLSLYPLAPCRVIDTRKVGNGQPFSGERTVDVETSDCAAPSTAQAYVFNATVVPTGSLSYLTLWPDSENRPTVSTLNAIDGAITSNMAIVPNIDGKTDAFAAGVTQLILDISSYFAP